MDGRIRFRVRLLVSVDLHLDVPEELLRSEREKLRPLPLVAGLVLPATMKEAHDLPHLVVVEFHLPFLLAGGAGAAGGGGSGASHLSIVVFRTEGVVVCVHVRVAVGVRRGQRLAKSYLGPP